MSPNENEVDFQYDWSFCSPDTNAYRPFEMDTDGRFLKLSNIDEGEYEFEVKVGYIKYDSEYRKDLEQKARGKVVSK